MKYDILLAGVGGQGVLSIAAVIASAAMTEGLQVRQSEVHGMSQRGGGVQAHLRISDTTIASDLIPRGKADMILSMEPLESLRYLEWLSPSGIIVTNAEAFVNIPNYPDIAQVYKTIEAAGSSRIVKSAELAKEAGNLKAENMVLIGAALERIPVSKTTIINAIKERFGKKDPKLVDINITALELGAKKMKTIVHIDNSDFFRKVMKTFLREKRYESMECASIAEAQKVLDSGLVSCVIMGLEFSDAHGVELIKKLVTTNKEIPIIVLTSDENLEHRQKLMLLGVEDYILKSMNWQERLEGILKQIFK